MRWVVPPLRCLWVPAGVSHRVQTIGEVWLRTVYIRPDRASTVTASLRVLDVSPLLRELLLEVGLGPQEGGRIRIALCKPAWIVHVSGDKGIEGEVLRLRFEEQE